MFDSLDEQMKHDDAVQRSTSERMFQWAAIAIASILVFGGAVLAVYMME